MNSSVKHDTLTPAQLQKLGLDAQPFNPEPPAGPPFRDGAIDTQVNVALHILQHTDQVLLVQGAAGLGKTAFLTLLNQASGDEPVLIHLHPGTRNPEADVQRAIAEAGGIDGADETSAVNALLRLSDMGQRPVLLLDDADRVAREAVDCLLALHATMSQHQATPGVVMAATRDLAPLITKHAREDGLEPHLVNLHPFDEEQTQAYISHRLRQAGSPDGAQLTESQCRQIHHRTRGNPANINREAARLLAAAVPVASETPGARKPTRWPRPVVILAVALLTGGLIAASYLLDEQAAPTGAEAPQSEAKSPAREERQPPEQPDRRTLEEKPSATQRDSSSAGAGAAGEPATTPGADAGSATVADSASATDMASSAGEPESTDEAADTQPAEESPTAPEAAAAPESESSGAEDTVEDGAAKAETGASEALEAAQAASEPTATAPRDAGAAPADIPPADHYTIQLVGAHERENLEAFIEDAGVADEARIVTTQREGRDWHVVVYGNYPSREAARSALQRLSEAATQHGPWIRSFGSLR